MNPTKEQTQAENMDFKSGDGIESGWATTKGTCPVAQANREDWASANIIDTSFAQPKREIAQI
jgi:hypothetical protein